MNEPILYAGVPHIPPPIMQLRVRKEVSTRDAVNARQFEKWQTDPPAVPYRDRPDLSGTRIVLDMNPINTRGSSTDYRQSQPYIPSAPQLGQNPYFDRYDPQFDPRNAIRELRSAVYEDKSSERAVLESKRIMDRGYTSRWVPEGYAETTMMNSLLSYEQLRPRSDDIRKNYRKTNQSGPQPQTRGVA
jgi:hypothetical protein